MKYPLPAFFTSTLTAIILTASFLTAAFAQNNPVPQIVGPVHPMAVSPGGVAFTLTVYGANFVQGAVVNWNYQARATTFVSGRELQAQILATDIANNTTGYISVTNPAPGGGSSSASWAQVEVHAPISTITVKPPVQYFIGAWMMSAADFTHDGLLDVMGQDGQYLVLDKGKRDGTFQFRSVLSQKYLEQTQLAYGDFNGDGNLDVALVNGTLSGPAPTHMSVRLGDGTGKFSAAPAITAYGGLGYVAVLGDFNQDGKLDLITQGQQTVSEFMGNGDGTFRHTANLPYSSLAWAMLVGDFNGDGKLDLVLMDPSITLRFMQGNGDGTFKSPQRIASNPGTGGCGFTFAQYNLQLSDFNGDGKLDLAFCTYSQIGVMLGNGDGTFQPPVYYTADSGGLGQFTYAIGDINSDGKPDLIVSEYSNFNSILGTFLGNGDGTFQALQTISSGIPSGELGVTVGDFNSDGLLDTIFQNVNGMNVFLQQ